MSLFHSIDNESSNSFSLKTFFILLILCLVVGIGAGYLFGKGNSKVVKTTTSSSSKAVEDSSGKTAGVQDKSTFKDTAEGTLQEGGIGGEGDFHLVRPGGDSQNVYLTSSTVDLSKYIGKKIKVHGQTMNGQKAGWLMDVGFVELQ